MLDGSWKLRTKLVYLFCYKTVLNKSSVSRFTVYSSPDSLEHTFLACSVAEDFYYEMMAWFNNEQKSQINMTKQQILFNDFTLPIELQQLLKWKFGIFITLMKKYIYDCKMMEKFPLGNQFKQKLYN